MDFDDWGWPGSLLGALARGAWWVLRVFASVLLAQYLWGWAWGEVWREGESDRLANQTWRARTRRYLLGGARVSLWVTVVCAPFAVGLWALGAVTSP